MVIVRPVTPEDLDQVVDLAYRETFGLTSLPRDARLLKKRINESLYAFRKQVEEPGGELYLFVMEDPATEKVIGTSCIVSKVGGFQPFYSYRIETCVHESKTLGIRKEVSILNLVKDHSGPSEIGGLLLDPAYRRHGNGRLLSLFRFLFMAEYPERFEPVVIAEMRGVLDQDGNSPFWDALGRYFFDMDYPHADLLSAMDKRIIADLMPTCPIYIPVLPQSAQQVIGQVHEQSRPALKILQDEGFRYTDMVDIFEAGPLLRCPLKDVRIVRDSIRAVVSEITSDCPESSEHIIVAPGEDLRACMGTVILDPQGHARVNSLVARALSVNVGNPIRFAPTRPSNPTKEKS
jgi:arginine N-succinyltransferase